MGKKKHPNFKKKREKKVKEKERKISRNTFLK